MYHLHTKRRCALHYAQRKRSAKRARDEGSIPARRDEANALVEVGFDGAKLVRKYTLIFSRLVGARLMMKRVQLRADSR